MRASHRLDYVAILFIGWAALAATGLLPVRDPLSAVVSTYAGCVGTVCLLGTWSMRGWVRTASCLLLLLLLGFFRVSSEIALASALGGVVWLRQTKFRTRTVRLAGVISLAALVVGSLKRTFDPLLMDDWLHRWTVGWLSARFYEADVAPAVYGLLLVPVGLAGVMATGVRARLGFAGASVLAGAVAVSRHWESAWPVAVAVVVLPSLLHAMAYGGMASQKSPARWRSTASASVWCVLVAATCVLGWSVSVFGSANPDAMQTGYTGGAPRIGFVGAMHGSFDALPLPEEGPEDPAGPPRFGQFRLLLQRLGARTVTIATPEQVSQNDWDALVTINFSGPTAMAFTDPLRQAVSNGAKLLTLADHTNLFQQIIPSNELLRETGIGLAFDSAVPLGLGASWVGCIQAGRHPVFGPHRDGRAMSWGVGCSLHVQEPARTVVAGTQAFLDEGDVSKLGGLGNLHRDSGEALGGYSLAAISRLGEGQVLVCGDTSAIQDTALLEGRRFGLRLAGWLLGRGDAASALGGMAWLARSLVVLLFLAACYADVRLAWVIMAVMMLAGGEAWWERRMRDAVAIAEPEGARLSLVSQYTTGIPPGLDGIDALLEQCASRNWAMCITDMADDGVPLGDAAVLIDPWSKIGENDASVLLQHVREGGRLLLFLGQRGARSADSILSALGLSIDIPLGRGAESSWEGPLTHHRGTPYFYSSWQIDGPGLSDVVVLASCFGRPVAVMGELGDGKWLLVADAGLVLNSHAKPSRGGSRNGALTLQYLVDPILDRIADG